MILKDDSPLRSTPSQLDHKQTLFLDGIRYAIDMADLSYTRLVETLLNFSQTSGTGKKTISHDAHIPAFLDAWSVIDSVHRLRGLLEHMPGVKKKTVGYQKFRRETAIIEDLRNWVQHLNTEIADMVERRLPVWGTLGWTFISDPATGQCLCCTLVAGSATWHSVPIINPAGRSIDIPIGLVTLTAAGQELCLTDIMRAVGKLARSMETQLAKQLGHLPKRAADLAVWLTFEFADRQG